MTAQDLGELVITVGAALVLVPIVVLFVECIAAVCGRGPAAAAAPPRAAAARTVVLVPAHDEEPVIGQTLGTLLPQLAAGDRLVVVADNCTDQTAQVARQAGAQVLERRDPDRRGKGYALAHGVDHLRAEPPDVVVIVDADCHAHEGLVAGLTQAALAAGRPAQAIYLLESPTKPSPKDAISALAFLVKNLVRPLGLHRLGFPCLLTGSGMAFPWPQLAKAPLASGNIVEDMQLGLDLALAGTAPVLCPATRVTSRLPEQAAAARSQRTRWEHGHLQTLLRNGPRLLARGLLRLDPGLVGLALDLCVPPLTFLVLCWLGTAALALAWGLWTSAWCPAILAGSGGALLVTAILASWARFGRQTCPPATFLALPAYVLWKIPMYLAFLVRPQTRWVRTARDTKPKDEVSKDG